MLPPCKKKRKRKTAAQRRRELRKQLIQRWDQLADDVHRLAHDIRSAEPGVFTPEEQADAFSGLDDSCWETFVNHRPRLPASVFAPRRGATARYRMAILDLDLFRHMSQEDRQRIFGDVTEEQMVEQLRKAREGGYQ